MNEQQSMVVASAVSWVYQMQKRYQMSVVWPRMKGRAGSCDQEKGWQGRVEEL